MGLQAGARKDGCCPWLCHTVRVGLGSPSSLTCLSFLPWKQHSFLPSCSWIEFVVSKFWCLLRQLWETDKEQLAKEAKEGIK